MEEDLDKQVPDIADQQAARPRLGQPQAVTASHPHANATNIPKTVQRPTQSVGDYLQRVAWEGSPPRDARPNIPPMRI